MTLGNRDEDLLKSDRYRIRILEEVRSLNLKDSWVGAGFVRNMVWDHLHGYTGSSILNDVDVVFLDPLLPKQNNAELEKELSLKIPEVKWSVKNQAYMHVKHSHSPYSSSEEAISNWVETATAVAVKLNNRLDVELLAPHGLEDLFCLKLRPVNASKTKAMILRIKNKQWLEKWPMLEVVGAKR